MPRLEEHDDPVLLSAQLTQSLLICVCPPARTELSLSLSYIYISTVYLSCIMHRVSIRTST